MSQPWKLHGYVVERLLGTGGSGEVWRARVAATGEPVALKRLTQIDSRQLRRIHSEAALLSALEHPNLIRLHAVVEDGDTYVLVLDLADGGSLADLLTTRGCLTPGEVVTAVAPVAAALAYAHGQGVVHGDVSTANLLFTAGGVPLLADLGVARLCGDDTEAESTPGYLDPATAVGYLPGPASDVFMLGGVALHALTGRPTWPGRSAAEMLAAARRGVLDDVAKRLRDAQVPDAMTAVISRALSSDSLGRGSAAEFALDLRQSAQPVAVELRAARTGLQRRDAVARGAREAASGQRSRAGGRHAAVVLADNPTQQSGRLPWRPLTTEEPLPGRPPPTAAVRPRPRPRLPRGPRTAAATRRLRIGAALLVAALAVVPVALWARSRTVAQPDSPLATVVSPSVRPPSRPPAQAGPARTASTAPHGAAPRDTTSAPGSSSPTTRQVTTGAGAARWARVLATLDAIRARAYATRDPSLLRSVYASAALRSGDFRTLVRLVPRGCVLVGARTSYTRVHPRRTGSAVVVSVTASLHAATLQCNCQRRSGTPPAGPVRMHIVLARSRDGPRIVRQWRSR